MRKFVAIVGPTGSGKSSLAERIAPEIRGEIVSCDSVQVYSGFDIGASKPSVDDRKRVPYHLVDVVSPTDPFHAGLFMACADDAIQDIQGRGKHAIVVGGTGLYLRALLHGLSPAPAIPEGIRDELQEELEAKGLPSLYDALETVDPDWACQFPSTDTQRILRGLAVFRATGVQLSALNAAHGFGQRRYDTRIFAIDFPREVLYERINQRVEEMIAGGLIEEVETLLAQGVPVDSKPMQAPGYVHFAAYLRGAMDYEEAVDKMKQSHRRYAKRQLTWLRKTPDVSWIQPGESPDLVGLLRWLETPAPQ